MANVSGMRSGAHAYSRVVRRSLPGIQESNGVGGKTFGVGMAQGEVHYSCNK